LTENYEEIVERCYNSDPKYTEIQPGVPEDFADIKTLGDLLEINYKVVGGSKWVKWTTKISSHFMDGQVAIYDTSDFQSAVAWAKE